VAPPVVVWPPLAAPPVALVVPPLAAPPVATPPVVIAPPLRCRLPGCHLALRRPCAGGAAGGRLATASRAT